MNERMSCRLYLACSTLLVLAGCSNPDERGIDVGASTTDADETAESSGATDDPTTGTSTTEDTDDGSTTSNPTGPDTDDSPVCGDGIVNGDEVCDDGINDGSHGSCLDDCSGLAEHCGDGIVNGDEVCDDGVNDGSYEGCAADCESLGPFCGDGVVQGEHETCDDGEHNEDGSGCNVDCIVSGTKLYQWTSVAGAHCAIDISFPVERADGSIYVATMDGCDHTLFLVELTPELEETAQTPVLFSEPFEFPYRTAMRGDDWLLGGWYCDYLVQANGALTEFCDPNRTTGHQALEAGNDEVYLTMKSGTVARWGAASPSEGDSPLWEVTAPDNTASELYTLFHATFGSLGDVVASGRHQIGASPPYTEYGYLSRWTADGTLQTSRTYTQMTFLEGIAATPDGGFVSWGHGNDQHLMKVDANLDYVWSKAGPELSQSAPCPWGPQHMVVDSVGDITVDCLAWPQRMLIKLDPNGNERWGIVQDLGAWTSRLIVDSNDRIIRATIDEANGAFRVDKFAP
jgi:hypothetical protein